MRIMGDEHSEVIRPEVPPTETQERSNRTSQRGAPVYSGGLEDPLPQVLYAECHQLSCFYLEALVRDDVEVKQIVDIVTGVVDLTTCPSPVDKETELVFCGFSWDIEPGCRSIHLVASVDAYCDRERLQSNLRTVFWGLVSEGVDSIVVNVSGYRPLRHEGEDPFAWMCWHFRSLADAWPKILPAGAERFGNPSSYVRRLT